MKPAIQPLKTTQILISVRNGEEAKIASRFPLGILDLKNPQAGSLGAATPEDRDSFLAVAGGATCKSVALGELAEMPRQQIHSKVGWQWLSQFQFTKIGLAGVTQLNDWRLRWSELRQAIPPETVLVGVAYADWSRCQAPSVAEVFDLVSQNRANAVPQPQMLEADSVGVVLLDTHAKSNGNLIELMGWSVVGELIELARSKRIKLVIAGSLRCEHLERLLEFQPDSIGFRGAVCDEGRTKLSEKKMASLFEHWARLQRNA